MPPSEYFVHFYSFQNAWNGPTQSHTFARFLRDDGTAIEVVDISWLPAAGKFGGIGGRRMPVVQRVPGTNYSVEDTITLAERLRLKTFPDGPYRATESLFDGAKRQAARLASGELDYVMLNFRGRGTAINCIRAVSRAAGVDIPTWVLCGSFATARLREEFRRRGLLSALPLEEKDGARTVGTGPASEGAILPRRGDRWPSRGRLR